MALSKLQIDELFVFTEKKFVKWYDLQVELVDHLANKIEEELDQNPKTNFEDALKKVYASFGIFGFARIVREKEEQVRKFNNKLWFKELKTLFVWPNLLKSLSLLLILKLMIDFIPMEYILYAGLLLAIIQTGFQFYKARMDRKHAAKVNRKLLLTQFVFFPNGFGYLYFQFWINIWRFDEQGDYIAVNKYVFLGVVFIITSSYIAGINVARKIYATAKTMYPEVFKAA